jgi:CelD/BcsL family acetyltransferase involved in cellulose biosynthesis
LRIVLHRTVPDDDVLRRQWNELVQRMERPEIFYTYEWAMAVYRAYGLQLVPLLLLAYENDTFIGLAALATNASQEIVFLSNTTADYCEFISHPQRRAELLDAVFAELKKMDAGFLSLANLPADSVTSRELKRTAHKYGYSVFARTAYSCAQVAIDSPEKRRAVKESAQRRMRRYAKTMGKNISVTFNHLKSPDDLHAELPGFVKAHVARFLATGRISNLATSARREFLEELIRSSSNWVTLSRLQVGEQTVAWNYGFQFSGSWFWYQPTFATGFQQYSPGLWLLSKIVEESCDDPQVDRIDLGLGAEGYKERLATASRETLHVTVMTSVLGCWKERIRYHSADAIRSVPHLEDWIRSGIRYISSLKMHLQAKGPTGLLRSLVRRGQRLLHDRSEFFLLERLQGKRSAAGSFAILPVDLDLLAIAAMHYVDDPETAAYLLRAAERLRSSENKGFALVTSEGLPVHFCWLTDFEKFSATESKYALKPHSQACAVIFDCWTPLSIRGQGHYKNAIAGVASQLEESALIFLSATNAAALRGAEAAGFVKRFSLLDKRFMLSRRVIESELPTSTRPDVEVFSAA